MFTETPPFPIHALCSENALLIEYILFVEESRLHNTPYRFHRLLSPNRSSDRAAIRQKVCYALLGSDFWISKHEYQQQTMIKS